MEEFAQKYLENGIFQDGILERRFVRYMNHYQELVGINVPDSEIAVQLLNKLKESYCQWKEPFIKQMDLLKSREEDVCKKALSKMKERLQELGGHAKDVITHLEGAMELETEVTGRSQYEEDDDESITDSQPSVSGA